MKKNTVVNLVLIGCIAGSIIFERFFGYAYFAGFICGSAVMLMISNYAGKRLFSQAAKRIDKAMKDQVLSTEFDNLEIEEDD